MSSILNFLSMCRDMTDEKYIRAITTHKNMYSNVFPDRVACSLILDSRHRLKLGSVVSCNEICVGVVRYSI